MDAQSVTIELSPRSYQLLKTMAKKMGKAPETLSRELLEEALCQVPDTSAEREAVRRILQTAGHTRPLSRILQQRIIPGVTLDEVRESLASAGGKPLSEIILEQRGPRT